ncbi:MAG: malonate decarboxylase subunit epsilon [Formivibrio sp.]|nr:malonate decarboxylase subunit epsilon [Formivibrio sp.]
MSVVFTFPGQGAQEPDMLDRLPAHTAVDATLDEASRVLGEDVRGLDSAESLHSTRAVQLSLLVAGVACSRLLAAEGCRPDMTMGLSIGAYAAAVCAEVLNFDDAVRLVSLRGHLMETAFPRDYGMAAVIGLDQDRVEAIVHQVHAPEHPVYVANINAADQIVVAGHDTGLAKVIDLAIQAHAKRAKRLAISVPSHCALLNDAAAQMADAFKTIQIRRSTIGYLSANAARLISDPLRIADDLAHNMARQVHWHDCARLAYERGMRLAVEMPPGSVLTAITRGMMCSGGDSIAFANSRTDTVLELCRRARDDDFLPYR